MLRGAQSCLSQSTDGCSLSIPNLILSANYGYENQYVHVVLKLLAQQRNHSGTPLLYAVNGNAQKMSSIGVANFLEDNYLKLINNCKVIPAVNQIETHVYRQQAKMHQLLTEHGTWHESWSPLVCGQNGFFRDPLLRQIADAHNKSIAQVGLRWLLQQGIDVIPKTIHRVTTRRAKKDYWNLVYTA